VTQQENIRRYTETITHCPKGHEHTGKLGAKGERICQQCRNEQQRAYMARKAG
jgi:anaerobic ribonucleoside-triphosphate reductase